MKDAQQITCQSSHTCTRDPEAWTTIHRQETMTQHPHAVADHGRRQHLTTSDLRDLIRQSLPLHHLRSRVVNKCMVLFKTMSGIYGRALDCDHPPTAIQKGGNAVMYYERCEICGNRWQRIPMTMVARDPETKLNNRTVLASTGKRLVEIERLFYSHGHGSMMMQVTPQQSLHWECSTCSTTSGLSLDGCVVRLVDRDSFEGADANMVPTGDDETRASERAGATEGCGSGGVPPIDLSNMTTAREPDYDPWTRDETESGIGRTSDRVFQHSSRIFQLRGARLPTDEVGPSPGAVWTLKEISMKCARNEIPS